MRMDETKTGRWEEVQLLPVIAGATSNRGGRGDAATFAGCIARMVALVGCDWQQASAIDLTPATETTEPGARSARHTD